MDEVTVVRIAVGIVIVVLLVLVIFRGSRRRGVLGPILMGVVSGASIAFLMRPSTILGQLPLGTVLSRGADLRGLDALLKPTAEMSFNYMLVGAILGGLAGIAWNSFSKKRSLAP